MIKFLNGRRFSMFEFCALNFDWLIRSSFCDVINDVIPSLPSNNPERNFLLRIRRNGAKIFGAILGVI